jgi:hypothetical protein
MKKQLLSGIAAGALMLFAGYAQADFPGQHPYYLHALSDLRAARWLIEHRPGDAAVSGHEDVALQNIDGAINDIKKAAIDDGKNIEDHPQIDAPTDHPGRLHKAHELLMKIHHDVDRPEDDPAAKDLKHRALKHIDAAMHEVDAAIHDVDAHR